MEKISDFFKDLKERVSNPFISSFIISWIIINWKVIISILFYKMNDLKLDGYTSFIDLIKKDVSLNSGFIYPIFGALLYTFFFPFFRNVVNAFNSWIKSWGNTWNLNIMKESKIPMSKYIELKEKYQQQSKLLEDTIEKESFFSKENKNLEKTISELNDSKNSFYEELQAWKTSSDSNILNGEWEFSVISKVGSGKSITRIHISGIIISFSGNSQEKQTIKAFYKSPISNQILIIMERFRKNSNGDTVSILKYQNLESFDNLRFLKGIEDNKNQIEYKKLN